MRKLIGVLKLVKQNYIYEYLVKKFRIITKKKGIIEKDAILNDKSLTSINFDPAHYLLFNYNYIN